MQHLHIIFEFQCLKVSRARKWSASYQSEARESIASDSKLEAKWLRSKKYYKHYFKTQIRQMKTSDLSKQRGFDILIQIVELRILQIRHTLAPFETDTKEHHFS